MKKAILILTIVNYATSLEGARGFIPGKKNWTWRYNHRLQAWEAYETSYIQSNHLFPYFDTIDLASDGFTEVESRFPLNELLDIHPQKVYIAAEAFVQSTRTEALEDEQNDEIIGI